jgi:DMSO/TMAO reductase YedYZ molybdopterin-dependent catalytic subunit
MKKTLATTCMIIAILGLLLISPEKPVLAEDTPYLEITNLTGASFNFSYAQLLEMPKTVEFACLYCYGALLTYGNWGGVNLSNLLTQAQLSPEVFSIQFLSSDGYKVAIPIDLAMQSQIIIAYERDEQPLPEGLRLIVPGANGAVWIAQITSISMSTLAADYPEPDNLVDTRGKMPTPSSTPQEAPSQQQESTQPTVPENSSSIQETTPNVTDLSQPTLKPQPLNDRLNLQTLPLYLIVFASTFLLTSTAYALYRNKRKRISKE